MGHWYECGACGLKESTTTSKIWPTELNALKTYQRLWQADIKD